MSKNNITGDTIKTKVLSKSAQQAYEDSYDRVFGKKYHVTNTDNPVDFPKQESVAQCPSYPKPCFCTGACKPSVLFKEQDCC